MSEARHNKKIFTPIRFLLDKLDGYESFDLPDVYSSTMKIIFSIQLEVVKEDKRSDNISIEFRQADNLHWSYCDVKIIA